MMCGGISNKTQPADDVLKQIIIGLEDEIRKECKDLNPNEVKPITYKSQLVAGTNYFVKVSIGNGKFVHVKVYQPLPHTGEPAKLTGVNLEVDADSEISFF